MDRARTLDALVPAGIDDAARPSGGNRYDRRVCDGLRARGWRVQEHLVAGAWPHPAAAARALLARALDAGSARGAPVLVDGMLACAAPDEIARASRRRPVVVLAHMPFGPLEPALAAGERRALRHASAVVATSAWTTQFLTARYGLAADRVHTVPPGADRAAAADGSPSGGRLLCVAAVTPAKGLDTLVAALERLAGAPETAQLSWSCRCAGSLETARGFARDLQERARRSGLDSRLRFDGALGEAELDAAYARSDLMLLPSRAETWGMVLTEALARGIPVAASDVGGVAEAVGAAPDGTVPGLLLPADDDRALARALRRWLTDATLRAGLRAAARQRRPLLPGWEETARRMAAVLDAVRMRRNGTGGQGIPAAPSAPGATAAVP